MHGSCILIQVIWPSSSDSYKIILFREQGRFTLEAKKSFGTNSDGASFENGQKLEGLFAS